MPDKVLVADDEPKIRDVLNRFLTEEGYEVIMASNGDEALYLAAEEDPGLILLDVRMPGVDGIEVCRKLKAAAKTRFIPVIMITGFGDTRTDVIEAGADDFVEKPFHMVDLSIQVKSMLRLRYLTDELEKLMADGEELQKSRLEQPLDCATEMPGSMDERRNPKDCKHYPLCKHFK